MAYIEEQLRPCKISAGLPGFAPGVQKKREYIEK